MKEKYYKIIDGEIEIERSLQGIAKYLKLDNMETLDEIEKELEKRNSRIEIFEIENLIYETNFEANDIIENDEEWEEYYKKDYDNVYEFILEKYGEKELIDKIENAIFHYEN